MSLTVTVDSNSGPGYRVMSVIGEVDIATVGDLESAIASLDLDGPSLVLDLTPTEFMDSSGLRLIISVRERLAADGKVLKLAVTGGPISRLLDVTGLTGLLDVYASVDEALAS